MLQIQNTLVSLDLVERFFCCDLAACKGQCCLEGDAGAPVTPQEDARIKELLPLIDDLLLPAAKRQIAECGTSYRDPEGELVTQLVENSTVYFATLDEDGTLDMCSRESMSPGAHRFPQAVFSCHLYPVRIKEFPTFTAVQLRPAGKYMAEIVMRAEAS